MLIAVLAKSPQDFQDFIKEIHANKQASQIFIYVSHMNKMRGIMFDAVIKTNSSWQNPENDEIEYEIKRRINYGH